MVSCYSRGTSNAVLQLCEEQRTSGNFISGRDAQEHGSMKKPSGLSKTSLLLKGRNPENSNAGTGRTSGKGPL
jgi:hypothetical protein